MEPVGRVNDDTIQAKAGAIGFIFTIFTLNMLSRLGLAPLLPGIETDLSLSHASAGSLFLFVSVGYGSGLFGSTFISAKICHHHQIVLSSVAVGISLLALSLSASLLALQAALLVLGFAGGLYLPSGVATLTALVRRQDWAKVLSLHQLAPNLAYVCSPLIAQVLLEEHSWRLVVALYGIAAIGVGISYKIVGKPEGTCSEAPTLANIRAMLGTPAIWVMILLFSLALGVNQGLFSILPLYLTTERGLGAATANHLLTISRMVAFAMPLLSGWAADRYGLKRVMLVAVAASSTATFLVATLPDDMLGAGLIFQAGASVCFFPLGFAALSRITHDRNRNMAVALTVPFSHFFGAGVVPAMIGLAGDTIGFAWGIGALGVATIVGLFLLKLIKLP